MKAASQSLSPITMPALTLNQLILLRRFGHEWYRAGQLKGYPYGHPVAVENGLRPLMKAGLITVGSYNPTKYCLTDAGFAAQTAPDSAPSLTK